MQEWLGPHPYLAGAGKAGVREARLCVLNEGVGSLGADAGLEIRLGRCQVRVRYGLGIG